MIKKCKACGTTFVGTGKICSECITLLEAQNERTGGKYHYPKVLCRISGCYEKATETTLCKKHSEKLIHTETCKCKAYRCGLQSEVRGYCLRHIDNLNLSAFDLDNPRRQQYRTERVDVEDENVVYIDRLMPDFILKTNIVSKETNTQNRCKSTYGCLNPIHKDGLCEIHYKLKHRQISKDDSGCDTGKFINLPPKPEEPNIIKHCKTDGCNQVATHGDVCIKCYNKRVAERNSKLKEKILRIRAGH